MKFDLKRDILILERTPRVIRTLLADLPADWTDNNYGHNTWSPKQIVAHLIFGERTDWIPRARMILEHGESRAFDPFDRSGHEQMCKEKSLPELLDLFHEEREKSLNELRKLPLTPEKLARRGRHPTFGVVKLEQLLATWVVHDLNHIAQICKAMAYQHKTETGPWEQYLSILAPPAPR